MNERKTAKTAPVFAKKGESKVQKVAGGGCKVV